MGRSVHWFAEEGRLWSMCLSNSQTCVRGWFIVTSEAEPATRVKGQVREIAPQADLATRTRRVKITLVDPPLSFRLGTIVKAVAGMEAGAEIELPSSALLERDDKTFVWVVDAHQESVDARRED